MVSKYSENGNDFFVPQEVKLQHFCVNLHSILKYLSDNNSIFLSFVLASFKPYVQSA